MDSTSLANAWSEVAISVVSEMHADQYLTSPCVGHDPWPAPQHPTKTQMAGHRDKA